MDRGISANSDVQISEFTELLMKRLSCFCFFPFRDGAAGAVGELLLFNTTPAGTDQPLPRETLPPFLYD